MPYGFKQWLKDNGAEADPAKGVTTLVLDIVDNLTYPTPGAGLIRLDELRARLDGLSGGEQTNAAWEARLKEIRAMIDNEPWIFFPGQRVDPKNLVTQLKKLAK